VSQSDAFQFLEILDPDTTTNIVPSFLKIKLGIDIIISKQRISAILWFTLLMFTLRYYQVNIYIDSELTRFQ
jgi:hypothetical protein